MFSNRFCVDTERDPPESMQQLRDRMREHRKDDEDKVDRWPPRRSGPRDDRENVRLEGLYFKGASVWIEGGAPSARTCMLEKLRGSS